MRTIDSTLLSLSVLSLSTLIFFAEPASAKVDPRDPCSKELITTNGYVTSSGSHYYSGSQLMCNVAISNGRLGSNSGSGLSYDFQADGIFNLNESGRIYSYQLIAPSHYQNQFRQEGQEVRLNQGTLDWRFAKKDYSLSSIVHTPSGQDCLTRGKSDTTMELGSDFLLDLGVCEEVLAVNLGSSTTKQTAPLKRDQMATVSGVVDGVMRTCQVQIGNLFNYELAEIKVSQPTVVDGSNPCYMYMVKEFSHLPPVKGYEEFYKRHPNHACRSMNQASLSSVKVYRALPKGLTPLSPEQDISYRLRPLEEVRGILQTKGRGEGCRVLAPKLSSNSSAGSSNSHGTTKAQY